MCVCVSHLYFQIGKVKTEMSCYCCGVDANTDARPQVLHNSSFVKPDALKRHEEGE